MMILSFFLQTEMTARIRTTTKMLDLTKILVLHLLPPYIEVVTFPELLMRGSPDVKVYLFFSFVK